MEFSKPGPDPNAPYQKMYVTLFKAVTAALWMMKARGMLVRAQQETEELYIEAGGPAM